MAATLANHLSKEQIEERVKSTEGGWLRDKYRALLWLLQGETYRAVARRLGIDLSTLVRWVQRYNAQGEKGLYRKRGQGKKRVLNSERMQKIKQWVSEEKGGWTLERMKVRLKEEEGIEVSPQGIWYRLREEKWSWKTGRPSYPKADKKEKEAFKKRGLKRRSRRGGE